MNDFVTSDLNPCPRCTGIPAGYVQDEYGERCDPYLVCGCGGVVHRPTVFEAVSGWNQGAIDFSNGADGWHDCPKCWGCGEEDAPIDTMKETFFAGLSEPRTVFCGLCGGTGYEPTPMIVERVLAMVFE